MKVSIENGVYTLEPQTDREEAALIEWLRDRDERSAAVAALAEYDRDGGATLKQVKAELGLDTQPLLEVKK